MILFCIGNITHFNCYTIDTFIVNTIDLIIVIKPIQTRWAIVHAHKILAESDIKQTRQFRYVYRILATARNDLEAAKLWKQMDEIREKAK